MGGDQNLFCSLARFFIEDAPDLLRQIQDGLLRENAEQVTRAAHSLRGLAANFDALIAVEAARQVEDLGRSGRLTAAFESTALLEREVLRLNEALAPFGEVKR